MNYGEQAEEHRQAIRSLCAALVALCEMGRESTASRVAWALDREIAQYSEVLERLGGDA